MVARTVLLGCLGWLACAGEASAYCRTHTDDEPPSTCPDVCQNRGIPLAWPTPQVTYAFNEQGFPGIADADLRRMFALSVAPWEAVTCEGQSIGIASVQDSFPTALRLGPKREEPNQNVIVYFSLAEWKDNGLGDAAYASTQVWFNPHDGTIIGADMMFNGSKGPFAECAESGCTAEGPRVDIRNVATHEFGHFLGLAHSEDPLSTMYCNAVPREVQKRTLSVDDSSGLCAVYPPGQAFLPEPEASAEQGCSLGRETSGGWLLLLSLWARRRRRTSPR